MKFSKSLKSIDRQWFIIRVSLAAINDFRFPFTYVKKRVIGNTSQIVGVRKIKNTIDQLRSIANTINKLANYLEKYPQVELKEKEIK
jgi:hypothetical protein